MGWESIAVVGFDLRPLLQGQTMTAKLAGRLTSIAKLICAYSALIIGPRGMG